MPSPLGARRRPITRSLASARPLPWLTLALLAALAASPPTADGAEPQTRDSYSSQYVNSLALTTVVEGGVARMNAAFELAEHYHVYWRNPGDSGLAPKLKLVEPPPGLSLGEIIWSLPDRIQIGPLVNYGYSHRVGYRADVLLNEATVADPELLPGEIIVDLSWLVCRIECVPEKARLRYRPARPAAEQSDRPLVGQLPVIDATRIDSSAGEGAGNPEPGWLALSLHSWSPPSPETAGGLNWHLAGFDAGFLEPSAQQRLRRDPASGQWSILFKPGLLHQQLIDKARQGDGRINAVLLASAVSAQDSEADLIEIPSIAELARRVAIRVGRGGADSPDGASEAPMSGPRSIEGTGGVPGPGAGSGLSSWLWAVLFAFLGGLILNIMPCVLPVLSIKLGSIVALSRKAETKRQFTIAILAQTAGVLSAVLALAGLLLFLRSADAALGWGFQLQSPVFVLSVSVVMLLVGLNLSGVFSVALPVSQGIAGAGQSAGVATKHFLSGLLVVILASPCTAPFMVSAFGYAWLQPYGISLTIFAFLGLGLASPYLALLVFPGLVSRLPKPGAWSADVQSLLAFPIYATVLWLIWVISQQSDAIGLAWSLLALWHIALLAWSHGRLIQRSAPHQAAKLLVLVNALLFVFATAPAAVSSIGDARAAPAQLKHPAASATAWSPAAFARLRAEGRPVFINFTAAWCTTCLWNESRVFSQKEFQDALQSSDTAYLLADWTNGDAEISRALDGFGRRSVPTYVYYPPGPDGQPVLLGQLPDLDSVVALVGSSEPR